MKRSVQREEEIYVNWSINFKLQQDMRVRIKVSVYQSVNILQQLLKLKVSIKNHLHFSMNKSIVRVIQKGEIRTKEVK